MHPLIATLSLIGWPKRDVEAPPVAEEHPVLPRPFEREFLDSRHDVQKERDKMFAAFRRGSGPL